MVKCKFLYALFRIFKQFRLEKVTKILKTYSDSEPRAGVGVEVEPRLPKIAGAGVGVGVWETLLHTITMYECSRTLGTLEFVCCKALANIFASF